MEYIHVIVQRAFGTFPSRFRRTSSMSSIYNSNIVPVHMHVDYGDVAIRYAIENDLCISSSVLYKG